jgi:hypothetical protein
MTCKEKLERIQQQAKSDDVEYICLMIRNGERWADQLEAERQIPPSRFTNDEVGKHIEEVFGKL